MRYIKLYEEFRFKEPEVLEPEVELSDKTIDDVLSDNFFDEEEEKYDDEESYIDSSNVISIKNWKTY